MLVLNAVVAAILTFKVWASFASPATLFGSDAWAAGATAGMRELGGRNLAMLILSLLAFRHPRALLPAVFLLGVVRETVDMVLVPLNGGLSAATLGQASSFLLFLVPYGVALRRLTRGTKD
jgi:hypothetical protein